MSSIRVKKWEIPYARWRSILLGADAVSKATSSVLGADLSAVGIVLLSLHLRGETYSQLVVDSWVVEDDPPGFQQPE